MRIQLQHTCCCTAHVCPEQGVAPLMLLGWKRVLRACAQNNEEDEDGDEDEADPDMAMAMGFAGFGGSRR